MNQLSPEGRFQHVVVFRSQVETGHVVQRGDRPPDEQHRPICEGTLLPVCVWLFVVYVRHVFV